MKNLLFLLFTFFAFIPSNSFAQNDPPPALMPSKADKLIIDSIVTVTHYEAYFRGRCEEVISEKAIAENWSAEKISKAKSQIKYADFKFDVHNVFGRYTHEEIKELLAKYKKDKTCRNNNVLLDSRMVEGNLNLYADRLGNE